VPAGETATVAGYKVGGMLYVGTGLTPVSLQRSRHEPSLLDPRRPVGQGVPDREGRSMSYWPSYSEILPESRHAYLEWLAGGRGPGAYIGYVFLFFYGIERRVLVDAAQSASARAEVDVLLAEVERLAALYGASLSFRGYARTFLSFVRLTAAPVRVEDLRPPKERVHFAEPPLALRLALGTFAKEGRPVPPEWAFSWALSAPEIHLRTPAERCPNEFRDLFLLRYREAFRGGLIVKPGKRSLSAEYFPASPTFAGALTVKLDLPDVAGFAGPLRKLQEIVVGAQHDLEAYSRWVGRTGDKGSPAAAALLPVELARGRETAETRRLVQWIEDKLGDESAAVVHGADLFAQWPLRTPGRIGKRDAEMLAGFLGARGFGLEPDVRFGGPLPSDGPAVLFRLETAAGEPTPAYHAAAVLLHLAVALAAADGAVSAHEERHLLTLLENALHLPAAERTRLKAHLRWLLAAPPGLGGLKKRAEPLSESQRRGIGQFLITVAGADGHVGAEELKLLTKIYSLLGLDPQSVYSDVHALASAEAATEPVTVRPAEPPAAFPIPAAAAMPPADGFALDLRKVQAKLAETEQVSSLLEGIFREEEAPHPPAPSPIPSQPPPGIAGLDAAHSELLRRLAEKTAWPRIEIERLANALGLLPDGALEVLNEAAFERCGAPLLEGDEMIEIDPQILEEITA
jgi:uncharacterized tellurite resistance protein B-like protein